MSMMKTSRVAGAFAASVCLVALMSAAPAYAKGEHTSATAVKVPGSAPPQSRNGHPATLLSTRHHDHGNHERDDHHGGHHDGNDDDDRDDHPASP